MAVACQIAPYHMPAGERRIVGFANELLQSSTVQTIWLCLFYYLAPTTQVWFHIYLVIATA